MHRMCRKAIPLEDHPILTTPTFPHKVSVTERVPARRLSELEHRTIITMGLWIVFAAVVYKVSTTKVESKIYDPFTILGLTPVSPPHSYVTEITHSTLDNG